MMGRDAVVHVNCALASYAPALSMREIAMKSLSIVPDSKEKIRRHSTR